MVYHMTIAGLERDLPVCKVSDSLYIGAFCHLWGSGAHGGSRPGAPEKRRLPMTTSSPPRPRASPWPTKWPGKTETKSTCWLGRGPSCT